MIAGQQLAHRRQAEGVVVDGHVRSQKVTELDQRVLTLKIIKIIYLFNFIKLRFHKAIGVSKLKQS